jgi:hypothetical protein
MPGDPHSACVNQRLAGFDVVFRIGSGWDERAAKRMIEKAGFRVPSGVMLTAQFERTSGERPVAGHRERDVGYAANAVEKLHFQPGSENFQVVQAR